MTNFGMARGLASLFSVIGWIVVVVGALSLFVVASAGWEAIALAAVLAGFGCLMVATGQILLAQIVTAESTQRLLVVMQGRSEGSVPVVTPDVPLRSSAVSEKPAEIPEEGWSNFDTYKGYKVEKHDQGDLYRCDGRTFPNLNRVQRYVNGRT